MASAWFSINVISHVFAAYVIGYMISDSCDFSQLEIPIRYKYYIMTSSNGNIFCVTAPLWGESTGHRWIPSQRPMTQSFEAFFDLRLNKRLSKQ